MRAVLQFRNLRACFVLTIAMLASVLSNVAQADVPAEGLWGVQVNELSFSPAAKGDDVRLRVQLENFSGADLRLLEVRAPFSEATSMKMESLDGGLRTARQFSILEDETLDFGTGHIQIQLQNLKRPFSNGEWVEVKFVFDSGVVPALAHVH